MKVIVVQCLLCALVLIHIQGSLALTSICPQILEYKTTTNSATQFMSWSAVVHIPSVHTYNSEPNLDIILNRSITHLSASNSDVMTSDWRKFNILRRSQTYNRIHMTVEFNSESVPMVEEIRLNGVKICPETTTITRNPNRDYNANRQPTQRTPEDQFGATSTRRVTTTERINYLATNDDSVNNNGNNSPPLRTPAPQTPSRAPNDGNDRAVHDVWNLNSNRDSTTTRRTTQVTRSSSRPVTTTTTSSPYFPGDLHMLFQSNGNDRRRSTENPLGSEPCGALSPSLNPLVVNGQAATEGQFPWHAALYISQGVQLKYTCGGNLISNQLVLTAAHCVTLKRSLTAINPEHLLIYLGKSDLLHWQGHEQDFSVEEIIVHPGYNYTRFYSDMALLKLKKKVRYTDHVRPVCLWDFVDLKQVVGKVGRVPGWGYNENGVVGTELSFVEMPVVTHETCIWSNREVFSRITSDSSYCAGFRNGSNVCNGDSGGGMVFNQGNRWYLKGVVSVSVAIQNHFLCDPDHYVVFGDVSKFKSWIEEHM